MPILDSIPNSTSNTELFGTNTELWSPYVIGDNGNGEVKVQYCDKSLYKEDSGVIQHHKSLTNQEPRDPNLSRAEEVGPRPEVSEKVLANERSSQK